MKKFLTIIFSLTTLFAFAQHDSTAQKPSNLKMLKISPLALTHKIAIHYEDQLKATNYSWGISAGFYYPMIGNNIYEKNWGNNIEWAAKIEIVGKVYWNSRKNLSGFYNYVKTGLSCMRYSTSSQYNNNFYGPPQYQTYYYGLNNNTLAVSVGMGAGIGYQNYLGKNKRFVYDVGLGLQFWKSGIEGNQPYTSADNDWLNTQNGGSVFNVNFRIGYVLKK